MTLQQWKIKNGSCRSYAHFDNKVCLSSVWEYISNPKQVAQHGFYPFIHYTQDFNRYNKDAGIKPKTREICYSAHIDRYIFQYYGYKLNQVYSLRVEKDKINDVAIAYRDNLNKNNINFAKQTIDFIRKEKDCYIIIGDFTKFFDNLDHKYLKQMICDLLDMKVLPPDYYAVYKNITKYSIWDMEKILNLNKLLNSSKGREKLNQQDKALSLKEFKLYKKQDVIQHPESFGIPQGSAISAVLSNIYMLHFDKLINDYILEQEGLYMRYSDDFIIVLPKKDSISLVRQYSYIDDIIARIPGIELEPEKTQIFKYNNKNLCNCNNLLFEEMENGKDIMNYLGFSFDGQVVAIRDKTISKYYYKMYRKLNTIIKKKGYTKKKNKISCENLYNQYSIKGANSKKGNFITYVQKAEKIFGKDEAIGRGTTNHMAKIRKKLDQIEKSN